MSVVAFPPFTAAWTNALAKTSERMMPVTIQVNRPGTYGDWNPETDTQDYVPGELLYSGKARAQPLRTAVPANIAGNDTYVQTYLFSLPNWTTSIDFKVGDDVLVNVAPLNPSLLSMLFTVKEITDAGAIPERTLYAGINLERSRG